MDHKGPQNYISSDKNNGQKKFKKISIYQSVISRIIFTISQRFLFKILVRFGVIRHTHFFF